MIALSNKDIANTLKVIFETYKGRFETPDTPIEAIKIHNGVGLSNLIKFGSMVQKFFNAFNIDSDFSVKETYFDYGAGTKWTQIIAKTSKDDDGYQLLSPRDMEYVVNGDADKILDVFNDRIKVHLNFVITDLNTKLNSLKKIQEAI